MTNVWHLFEYVAYAFATKKLRSATIESHLSAIKFFHRISRGFELDTTHPVIASALKDPLENEFMNVVISEEDEQAGEAGRGEGRGNVEEGRFSEELFGGAVKSRPFGDLDETVGQVTEVLLLPLLASEDQQNRVKVWSLCPLFSLLSTCLRSPRCEEGMGSINATLGASIILADSHTVDNVLQLEDGQKEAVLSAHFAACDWIRELVNAFVQEPDSDTKAKLVRRVGHLCRLETDLLFMLKRYPGYRLPGSISGSGNSTGSGITSDRAASNKPRGAAGKSSDSAKGKGKGKATGGGAKKTKKTEGEMSEAIRDGLRSAMRPLSPEAVLVLGFPDMLIKTRNTQGETVCAEPVKVGLCGVHLLLQEMHGHLKRGLAPGKNMSPAFARLREAVVGNSLRGVEEEIGVVSSEVDDEDMIFPCLDVTLKVLNILCGSDEVLGSAAGRTLLQRCLSDVFSYGDSEEASEGQGQGKAKRGEEEPFDQCFDQLEDFASTVQQLPLAVQLVQVMEAVATARVRFLAARSPPSRGGRQGGGFMGGGNSSPLSPHQKLSTLCLNLLQRDWSNGDMKFVYKSSTLGVLVRTHLRWARDPLEAAEVMSSEMLPLLLETGECLGPAEGYPTLTAASFSHFFTPVLQALVTCWKDRTEYFARPRLPTDALLMRTHRMVLIFRLLVMFTKGNPTLSKRPVLLSVLKEGKRILQVFLRSISVLEAAFATNQAEVVAIFKDLQQVTRHMQSLCAHGKDNRDAAMSKEAPVVKKLLEEFIFR
eukprot:jgi/Undpi1/6838/HiC_scaffold_21.g09314.m1